MAIAPWSKDQWLMAAGARTRSDLQRERERENLTGSRRWRVEVHGYTAEWSSDLMFVFSRLSTTSGMSILGDDESG